jgi:hypothetical protein
VVEVTLASGVDTQRVGTAQVGRTGEAAEVTVTNEGEATLTGLDVGLEGSAAADYAVTEDLGEDPLASGESRTVSVQFGPLALGRREALLTATSAEGGRDTTALLGRGARLAAEASEARRGEPATLAVTVEGGVAVQAGTLKVRKGGASAYRALELTEEDGADPPRLSAQVPEELVTTRGIDYYAVLAGEAGLGAQRMDTLTVPGGGIGRAQRRPAHRPVSFDSLRAPVSVEPERYRMMTVSAAPAGGIKAALEASYGSYDPAQWRVLRWDPTKTPEGGAGSEGAEGAYVEYPSIDSLRPGEGVWLITAGGEGLSLERGGETTGGSARRIPLEEGWNQVGSPFGYAVRWDTVEAASGLDPEATDGPVAYVDSEYRYERGRLRPWRSAFVRVPGPDTLIVPPVAGGGASEEESREAALRGPVALRRSGPVGTPATGAPPTETPETDVSSTDVPSTRGATGGEAPRRPRPRRRGEGARPKSVPAGKPETGTDPSPAVSKESSVKESSVKGSSVKGSSAKGSSVKGSSAKGSSAKGSSAKESSTKEATTEEGRYTLRVEARPRGGQASRVWVGLRTEAKGGRDALDFAQAPPIGAEVRLSARETVSGEVVPHAGSFKPPSVGAREQGRAWTLELTNQSDGKKEVRLRLDSGGSLPEGQGRYVLDLGTERRVAPGATLGLEGGETRGLKVIVGTEAFARSESEGIELNTFTNELRGNYPNPFGGETTIAYTLSSEREVTIEIYDVLGRRVRTLVRGEAREAGLHETEWRGRTRGGTPAGSGVYFYRIEAGDFTETRKMVLVR